MAKGGCYEGAAECCPGRDNNRDVGDDARTVQVALVSFDAGEYESEDKDEKCIGHPWSAGACKECQSGADGPEEIVNRGRSCPAEGLEHFLSGRQYQAKAGPNLDSFHDGDGDYSSYPAEQARYAHDADNRSHAYTGSCSFLQAIASSDGYGGNGFHGLDWERYAKQSASQDVGGAGEE